MPADTLSDEVEPYLLREHYIQRTPRGRQATPRAYQVLGRTVRVVNTDGQGQYRVIALRPGTYRVTFSLPGFRVESSYTRGKDIEAASACSCAW